MTKSFEEFLEKNKLQIMNEELTRFESNVEPTCIDHIITNVPQRISKVQTTTNIVSDHETVTCKYNNNAIIRRREERIVRNNKMLTKENLCREFDNNEEIHKAIDEEDPDLIASIINHELTNIIDKVAPAKVVQVRKNDSPTLSKETKEKMEENKKRLEKAKKTRKKEDWIEYKANRNEISKMVNEDKKKNLEKLLNDNKDKWNVLKKACDKESSSTPEEIKKKDGKITRKPKEIAEIANVHYIEKIKKIRDEMMKTKVDPIMMLKKLIPRQEKTMNFPLIKLEETKKLIQKLPNTTSHGMDPMTNKTLKKMESRITPLLTHLINSIIKKEKFPQVMKITRIVPILKKGKDVRDIDSYRPINNLMCLEKIIEEYFKRKMEEFIKENEILNPNHHGGRKHHSTITAKSAVEIEALKANEEGRTVAIYSTDLSAAYDTIDHRILRSKLEHYGFRGSSGTIIKSYLTTEDST